MAKMNVATIDEPVFINLQPLDVNPLMSKCEIKVLYTGKNRNQSYISKEVAIDMAKTLRGAPIVGWYKDDKQDFVDHGDQITIDGNGITFSSLTKPYGFVSPDADVWFQKFEETDDFGNTEEREYLMTTGYLWTGQYEEAKAALEGRPQSMELDEESLNGKWATDSETGLQFFIINDATFSKLCILGEDVEPCFEGSQIYVPEVNASFTLDARFKQTLYNMMQELKFALKEEQKMNDEKILETEAEKDFSNSSEVENLNEVEKDFSDSNEVEKDFSDSNEVEKDFSNSNEVEKDFSESLDKVDEDNLKKSKDDIDICENNELQEFQEKYSQLETTNAALQEEYNQLLNKYQELIEFKRQIEDEKKDELINSFYMLSDDDKKDVIANKSKYSLDEIEAKLSVICVRKKVSYDLQEEKQPTVTYNLNEDSEASIPAWISAVKETKKMKDN